MALTKLRQFLQSTDQDVPELLDAGSDPVEIKALLQSAQQDVTLYEQFATSYEIAEPEVSRAMLTMFIMWK